MGINTKTQAGKAKTVLVVAIAVTSFYFICVMALRYVHIYQAIFGTGVAVSSISVRELNPTNATVEIALCVDNPSPIDVILNRIEYHLYLNGGYLGGRNLQRQRVVSSKSSIPIPIEMAVGSNRIDIISEAVQADEWRWLVDGSLHIKNPLRNTVLIPFTIKFSK